MRLRYSQIRCASSWMALQRGGQVILKSMPRTLAKDLPHTLTVSGTTPKRETSSSSPRRTAGQTFPELTRSESLSRLSTVPLHRQQSTRARHLSRCNPSSPRAGYSSSKRTSGSPAVSPTHPIARLSVFLSLPTQTAATASDNTSSTYDINRELLLERIQTHYQKLKT